MTNPIRHPYPPTRWQVMAETGGTVDEAFDAYQAFTDMMRPLEDEWDRLRRGTPTRSDCLLDAAKSADRDAVAAAKSRVSVATGVVHDAIDSIVAMVDARRHASKAVNLSGAERERALKLLEAHDTTDMKGRSSHRWSVFWRGDRSGIAAQLTVMLAADADVRRAVTGLLITADTVVREALEAVEDGLRARMGTRDHRDAPGLEPKRDREARQAREAAERAELEALGVTLGI